MLMEALRTVSYSWPLAVMFIALVGACTVLGVVRQFRKWDAEDKEYKASQARDVTPYKPKRDSYEG